MKHLLIVDDEVELAEALGSILETSTLRVIVCFSAQDALKKINEKNFDCIVSDLSMPLMTGVEFLKQIRGLGYTTPFIIYTAFGSDENAMEAAKYGCYDFIEKPQSSGLKESVHRALTQANKNKPEDLSNEYEAILELLKNEDKE